MSASSRLNTDVRLPGHQGQDARRPGDLADPEGRPRRAATSRPPRPAGAVAGSFTVTRRPARGRRPDVVRRGPRAHRHRGDRRRSPSTAADGSAHTISTGDGTLTGPGRRASTPRRHRRDRDDRADRHEHLPAAAHRRPTGQADVTLISLTASTLLGTATSTAGQDAQITVGWHRGDLHDQHVHRPRAGGDRHAGAAATAGTTSTITVAQDSRLGEGRRQGARRPGQLPARLDRRPVRHRHQHGDHGTSASGGPLAGDTTVRVVRDALAETVFGPARRRWRPTASSSTATASSSSTATRSTRPTPPTRRT